MGESLQRFRQYAIDGLREFSEHPIEYPSRALGDFIKDYWDLGLAVSSGLAWTQHRDIYSKEIDVYLAALGPIVSIAAGGWMHLKDSKKAAARSARNLSMMAATVGIGNGHGDLHPLTIGNLIMGVVCSGAAAYSEFVRREYNPTKTGSSTIGPLENRVQ